MASTINASTSSGIVQTADLSGQLQLQTANTTALTIDSSQNVGIGTTSPAAGYRLVVNTSGATSQLGITAASGYSSVLSIGGNGTSLGSTSFDLVQSAGSSDAYVYNRANTNLIFGTNNTERMRIDSSGNLLVGTTSTFGGLAGITSATNFVVGSSSQYWKTTNFSATYYFNYNGADKATINGSTGAYTALSDANKKKDFEQSTLGLDAVMALKPTLFRMIDDEETENKQLGFLAQDVQSVIPQAYTEQDAPDGKFIGLQDRPIIAVLAKAIQEQQALIESLTTRLTALENK